MISPNRSSGFTLVEIAIVLLVVTVLLGYTLAMVPVQQELKEYRTADREMDQIISSLIGFAQINGRLPCPDTSGGVGNIPGTVSGVIDGLEDNADNWRNSPDGTLNNDWLDDDDVGDDNVVDGIFDSCLAYAGFLPARTLGLSGDIDGNGRLLDPWGQPYRYIVSGSNADANSDGDDGNNDIGIGDDLVTANGLRDEGLAAFAQGVGIGGNRPDLFVCDDSDTNASQDDDDCTDVNTAGANEIAGNVAAIVLSTGKDRNTLPSQIQQENTDNFHDGLDDKVYVWRARVDVAGEEFDDLVKWLSMNQLITKMIEAGQLP